MTCNLDDDLREAREWIAENPNHWACSIMVDLVGLAERQAKLLNTPEVEDFATGAVLEAAHQRARWPSEHDVGKTPFDWFWLIGYLAQKAAAAAVSGDLDKARHHTISTAAALANWHLALSDVDRSMCPGLPIPPEAGA